MSCCMVIISFLLLAMLRDGEERGADARNQYGQDDRARAGGQRRKPWQYGGEVAQHKAREHERADDAVLAGWRDDDPEEHAVERNREGADDGGRQDIARDDAKSCADGPARQRERHGPVVVVGIERTLARNRDAEDLVGHVEADEDAVPDGGTGLELLREGTAHEHVARVGNECDEDDLEVGRIGRDDREASVLAGRGVVEEAREEALQWVEPRIAGGDAEREGDHEVAECDRHAVVDTLEEDLARGPRELWFK